MVMTLKQWDERTKNGKKMPAEKCSCCQRPFENDPGDIRSVQTEKIEPKKKSAGQVKK